MLFLKHIFYDDTFGTYMFQKKRTYFLESVTIQPSGGGSERLTTLSAQCLLWLANAIQMTIFVIINLFFGLMNLV